MSIHLDDEIVPLEGETLSEVLQSAKARTDANGRLVVEIRLDDEPLSPEQIEQSLEESVAEREVHLVTAEAGELAATVLEQIEAALEDVKLKQERAGELLQQDEAGEAMQNLGEVISVWLQAQQAIAQSATLAGIELGSLAVDGRSFDELAAELVERLEELKSLIETNDTVSLGDVLQYEWPELTDRWKSLVHELRDRVEK
ncbi:MAG: hypothetical protein ACOC3G_08430 [Phycisphaeraceae bacterium]